MKSSSKFSAPLFSSLSYKFVLCILKNSFSLLLSHSHVYLVANYLILSVNYVRLMLTKCVFFIVYLYCYKCTRALTILCRLQAHLILQIFYFNTHIYRNYSYVMPLKFSETKNATMLASCPETMSCPHSHKLLVTNDFLQKHLYHCQNLVICC